MRKDRFTQLQRSQLMSRIRSKDTNFETRIFKELRRRGVRFHTHYRRVIGKPDIALPRTRKAVFLHSDFWHGWRLPAWEHVLPSAFWKQKLRRNRTRDKRVLTALRRQGWKVLVVWGHDYKRDPAAAINKIIKFCNN